MKVLHLPNNIASQISITVRALRDIGIEARGLVKTNHPIQSELAIENLPYVNPNRYSFKYFVDKIYYCHKLRSALKWADVVHWHFVPGILPRNLDLKYIKFLKKARIVEFWGSDIRIQEIACRDNPYITKAYERGEMPPGPKEGSIARQSSFAQCGFECLIPCPELLPYLQRNLFSSPYISRARLILSDFEPSFPVQDKSRPLIVHCPSNKGIKGTQAVLRLIEELKASHDFEFKLIHDMPRDEALSIIRNCDIMLDQFVLGHHGLVALEAMALGKPTICYLKPSMVSEYPDLPIVNANQENLKEVVKDLLEDGPRRYEIGLRSRAYVEKYHDAHKIAIELVNIYQELLEKVKH